jgi:hypothetical protein
MRERAGDFAERGKPRSNDFFSSASAILRGALGKPNAEQ